MPELPEVERVRLSLVDHLIGKRVSAVTVRRAEVVERGGHGGGGTRAIEEELLRGCVIRSLVRKGKQIAILGEPGEGAAVSDDDCPAICVHLGMTGSLTFQTDPPSEAEWKHTHVIWRLETTKHSTDGSSEPPRVNVRMPRGRKVAEAPAGLGLSAQTGGYLLFDDPRRFGGIWTFNRFADLREKRWSQLGEDALRMTPRDLFESFHRTTRGLKATLLDQSVVAGLGNIYVDELLFELGLHPSAPVRRLTMNDVHRLVPAMRRLLRRAIASGGSSLRDYVDGNGAKGAYQLRHQVYGRGGEPCRRCETPLRSRTIAGRTTVWCATCQRPVRSARSRPKE